MKELTERQKQVLSFITRYIDNHYYPPTIREIAEHFAISVKGAHDHVAALKKKKRIRQDGKRSRAMELIRPVEDAEMRKLSKIPIVGTVAAGAPILSEENWDGTITVSQSALKKNKTYFAVKVQGDSMSGAGIMDGDLAVIEKANVVKNGEIAIMVVDDAFTLKRYFKENTRIKLQAENPAYKPMYCQNVRVVGRLSQIIRNY
ncbi:MAG: transcriptional repressor LexA [Treponema sp.]|nr:transcriptional repressor LexA [Treponema sp.]